jgi:uncharacterized protein YcfJ
MRKLVLTLSAVSLAMPLPMLASAAQAEGNKARQSSGSSSTHHHRTCRHSSGTAGLIAGGVGGALIGKSVFGHGALGTIAGGVGGAFAGRAIDRTITAKKRCT